MVGVTCWFTRGGCGASGVVFCWFFFVIFVGLMKVHLHPPTSTPPTFTLLPPPSPLHPPTSTVAPSPSHLQVLGVPPNPGCHKMMVCTCLGKWCHPRQCMWTPRVVRELAVALGMPHRSRTLD